MKELQSMELLPIGGVLMLSAQGEVQLLPMLSLCAL